LSIEPTGTIFSRPVSSASITSIILSTAFLLIGPPSSASL